MGPAPARIHSDLNVLCNQLTELASCTIPQAGDLLGDIPYENVDKWLSALAGAVENVRLVATSPYPYDNSH
jgi:hypothetical protein